MRLRYLHIPDLVPLKNITITFGHEPILGRECTIHFIVGVNGTGKSRLLRAVTEVFLNLEKGNVPPFPVTIAYDLGKEGTGKQESSQAQRTIYYRYTGNGKAGAHLVELKPVPLHAHEVDWTQLHEIDWQHGDHPFKWQYFRQYFTGDDTAIKSYLPAVVLAYTSGTAEDWEQTFSPPERELEETISVRFSEISREDERPLNWNSYKEAEFSLQEGEQVVQPIQPSGEAAQAKEGTPPVPGIGIFIRPETLKLVVCAVTLSEALREIKQFPTESKREGFIREINRAIKEKRRMEGLRDLLNRADWLWPISIGLRITFRPDRFRDDHLKLLTKLYTIATKVIRDASPSDSRTLFFDLQRILYLPNYEKYDNKSTLEALTAILGNGGTQTFAIFQQLFTLQEQGVLEDVTIALQKRNLKKGVLLYEWLSDGERMLLGRMALFHLLQGIDDALIILDEPETHFNDAWKREVTDIIDQSLQDSSSEVLLATHSSIVLTDVFDTEITVLHKNMRTGTITSHPPQIRSFGASPAEILRDIFNAPETIGRRAGEFLNLMLLCAAHPAQTQQVWSMNGNDTDIYRSSAFRRLRTVALKELDEGVDIGENDTGDSEDNEQLRKFNEYLLHTLRSVRDYTKQNTGQDEINVVDMLDLLQNRLGAGYYQFEFRRRLNALQVRRGPNAP